MATHLPPMPPSDEASLEKNTYDGFYEIGSRDFWGENKVERIPEKPFRKCDHFFISAPGGIACTKCHFGLLGSELSTQDGKAYARGEQIDFSQQVNS